MHFAACVMHTCLCVAVTGYLEVDEKSMAITYGDIMCTMSLRATHARVKAIENLFKYNNYTYIFLKPLVALYKPPQTIDVMFLPLATDNII